MNKNAFTLIELLIVIGIIAILASAVIVAINPGQQFAAARDATREQHINSLQNSLLSYQISNQGWGDLEITDELIEICNTNLENPDCTDLADISDLVDDGHINQIPVDPQAEGNGTGYYIAKGSVILVAGNRETRFIGVGAGEDDVAFEDNVPTLSSNGEENGNGDFSCGDTFTDDRDGETYETVEIGGQCWFAENLALGVVNEDALNGDLEYVESDSIWKDAGEGDAYYTAYEHEETNAETYGFLYNWMAVDELNLCPEGWSVPTSDGDGSDWHTLEEELKDDGESCDGTRNESDCDPAGAIMKAEDDTHGTDNWNDASYNCDTGDNYECSGFNALPGGFRRGDDGSFESIGSYSHFWSSSNEEAPDGGAWDHYLSEAATGSARNPGHQLRGYSVRCLKDEN